MSGIALTTFPSARNDATEDRWFTMMSRLFTDGVHAGTSDTNEFRPYGDSSGMQMKVDTGACNIGGFYGAISSYQTLSVAAADATNNRIDRTVLRLDRSSPVTIYLDILTGTPALSPAPPALTVNNTITEISLDQIIVGHGVSTIRPQDVIDERTYCLPRVAVPAGTVFDFVAPSAPTGFLLLAGQTGLLVATYPDLAHALGVSPTATTFDLPDARSKFLRGANGDLLGTGGAASTVLSAGQIPALPHHHDGASGISYIIGSTAHSSIFTNAGADVDHSPAWNISATSSTADAYANPAAAGTPVPTVPPYLALNKIIKAH